VRGLGEEQDRGRGGGEEALHRLAIADLAAANNRAATERGNAVFLFDFFFASADPVKREAATAGLASIARRTGDAQ